MHTSQFPERPASPLQVTVALSTVFRPSHGALCLSTSFPLAAAHVTKWASRAYLTCRSAVTRARLPSSSRPAPLLPLSPMQALRGRTWLALAMTAEQDT